RFKDELCQRALQCLGGSKDASHLSQLVRGAAHPSYRVRLVAATSLGNTFSREAAPQLLDLLKDDAEPVRQEAQKALDQIASYLDARAKWEARLR
ncbi:MAG TPA: HEAT repeat domain-containing protein, partial [Planctomycetota bacterium]|nr:HEAT repeat domain-containing protein [Planctomycetota bacterium]